LCFGLARFRLVPPAREENSMSRIISALLLAVAAVTAHAEEPLQLVDNVPDRHVVVKGDTLWDISGKFLKEPWRWPEIWRLNKEQIKNPHLIYPGDIVLLDMSDGHPRLRIGKPVRSGTEKVSPKVYNEPLAEEIPSIPPNIIEPFISQPLIVDEDELKDAPRIVDTPESRVVAGNGDEIFVLGLNAPNDRWFIYRPGVALKDPTTKEVLGYEAAYLGTAIVRQPGEVALMEVLTAREEILKGNLLLPAEDPGLLAYVPHRLEQDVSGQVASIYGGVGTGGKNSVVAINRGKDSGLERGHVLGLFTKRVSVYQDKDGKNQTVALPEQRYGLVFIFRTFDRVSYGLVMEASRPLTIGDVVHNP